ncbi:MAG: baseplate assembly protein [Synechococcus sp.]
MTFSIANLPEPELIEELDYEAIFRELMADFLERHPSYTALLESDPAVKLLQVVAYRELILRQRVNDAFKATLLAFSGGGDLDNLAAFYGVERQTSEPDSDLRSRTIERIKGSSTAGGAAWYRFQTLTADERVVDALVTSPDAGEVRIAILSNEGPAIKAASGTELDTLGAVYGLTRNTLQDESDADFRARVLQAALGGRGDGAASTQLLQAVNAKVHADDVRVITDTVEVISATIVQVDVVANVYLYPDQPAAILNGLEQSIRTAFAAEGGLGWDLATSWLISRLHVQGVQRVELASPATTVVADSTTAVALGAVTITLAGYDR